MHGFTVSLPETFLALSLGALAFQCVLTVCLVIALRVASRDRHALHTELFGLTRRIEGLTASRREQILKHYDKILEGLAVRIPTTVASQASQVIFETESRILARLAELEPALKENEEAKAKMDELIRSMERLEDTLVALTSDTVRKALLEGRRSLLDDEGDISLAA